MKPAWLQVRAHCKIACCFTTSIAAIHFFLWYCYHFTTLFAIIRCNRLSLIDSRKFEEYCIYLRKVICGPTCSKVPAYLTKLARLILSQNICVRCLKAFPAIPLFNGECVNLAISRQQLSILYSKFFRRGIVHIWLGSKELLFWSNSQKIHNVVTTLWLDHNVLQPIHNVEVTLMQQRQN